MNKYRVVKNKYDYYKVQIYDWVNPNLLSPTDKEWKDLPDDHLYTGLGDAKDRMQHEIAEATTKEQRNNDEWVEVL